MTEIGKNNQPIDFLDLTYNLKDSNITPISFIKFKGPNHIFESLYNGDIALEDVETEQRKLKSHPKQMRQGPRYNKSPEQLNAIKNI